MQRGSLSGIVMTDVDHGFTREATLIAQTQGIPFDHCSQDELESGLVSWLREISPDAVIVMTFPYKLPAVVLDLPPMGCWNFHMALLPTRPRVIGYVLSANSDRAYQFDGIGNLQGQNSRTRYAPPGAWRDSRKIIIDIV